ncbi:MAG: hypothetical protein KGV50_00455 [Gammaproteobacteria bacterium]|nr:hypothetical protein [Gammaproteobacteria bacterium]
MTDTEIKMNDESSVKFAFDEDGFATADGVVTVYIVDNNDVYISSAEEHVTAGTGLSAGAYIDEPPAAKDGHVIVRKDGRWQSVEDHRGKVVYMTDTGEQQEITKLGKLPKNVTNSPKPTPYHTWSAKEGKWHLTTHAEKEQLAAAKRSKLFDLNNAATLFVDNAVRKSDTPDFERATWLVQGQEAVAWHADKTAATPNLDRIAQNRGVPADVLKQKAYGKAIAYELLTSTIAGQRQRFVDVIKAAQTIDELKKIKIKFKVSK